jgi:hypothetical protein
LLEVILLPMKLSVDGVLTNVEFSSTVE